MGCSKLLSTNSFKNTNPALHQHQEITWDFILLKGLLWLVVKSSCGCLSGYFLVMVEIPKLNPCHHRAWYNNNSSIWGSARWSIFNKPCLPHLVHVYCGTVCTPDKLSPVQEGVNDLSWSLAETLPIPQPLPVIAN